MPTQTWLRWPLTRYRQYVGLVLMLLAVLACLDLAWRALSGLPHVGSALASGSVAALATALGALPVMLAHRLPDALRDTLTGFGAGVMLAASVFSLIIPGLAAAASLGPGRWQAGLMVAGGIGLGAILLLLMTSLLATQPAVGKLAEHQSHARKRAWLFVFAIVLHNLPEGLAIGVGHASGDSLRADALTTGIAVQDVPEGFVVATALAAVGYKRLTAVLLGMASGLIEPVGAVLGAAVIAYSAMLLPWGLAFAAGAMLFVVCHEVIPESQRGDHPASASGGLLLGFVTMMLLDTALG